MPHWRRLHPLKTAKHLFWKQECPKKGHTAPDPGADCTPGKRQNIYFGNTNAPKKDMPHPTRAPIAPPENTKSFFPKTQTPVFGTVINDNIMITHSANLQSDFLHEAFNTMYALVVCVKRNELYLDDNNDNIFADECI